MRQDPEFMVFYQGEYASVYGAAYLLCRDRAAAEDAAQEAFARALERWARLREAPWAGGWVMSTALNLVRRALRRRPALAPAATEQLEPEVTLELWRRVGELPLRQQQAVVLHYRLGLALPEVAQAMELAESTVRVHLVRARESLRQSLHGVRDANA